jgi:hypothetical protein
VRGGSGFHRLDGLHQAIRKQTQPARGPDANPTAVNLGIVRQLLQFALDSVQDARDLFAVARKIVGRADPKRDRADPQFAAPGQDLVELARPLLVDRVGLGKISLPRKPPISDRRFPSRMMPTCSGFGLHSTVLSSLLSYSE